MHAGDLIRQLAFIEIRTHVLRSRFIIIHSKIAQSRAHHLVCIRVLYTLIIILNPRGLCTCSALLWLPPHAPTKSNSHDGAYCIGTGHRHASRRRLRQQLLPPAPPHALHQKQVETKTTALQSASLIDRVWRVRMRTCVRNVCGCVRAFQLARAVKNYPSTHTHTLLQQQISVASISRRGCTVSAASPCGRQRVRSVRALVPLRRRKTVARRCTKQKQTIPSTFDVRPM